MNAKSAFLRLLLFWLLMDRAEAQQTPVKFVRVPDGGIQPQALIDSEGFLNLGYLRGDPRGGDVFYARRAADATNFTKPLRVNAKTGSAVALGTVRGAQIAL